MAPHNLSGQLTEYLRPLTGQLSDHLQRLPKIVLIYSGNAGNAGKDPPEILPETSTAETMPDNGIQGSPAFLWITRYPDSITR